MATKARERRVYLIAYAGNPYNTSDARRRAKYIGAWYVASYSSGHVYTQDVQGAQRFSTRSTAEQAITSPYESVVALGSVQTH